MRLQYCHFCDAGDQVLVGGWSISRGKTVFRTNESMRLQPMFLWLQQNSISVCLKRSRSSQGWGRELEKYVSTFKVETGKVQSSLSTSSWSDGKKRKQFWFSFDSLEFGCEQL